MDKAARGMESRSRRESNPLLLPKNRTSPKHFAPAAAIVGDFAVFGDICGDLRRSHSMGIFQASHGGEVVRGWGRVSGVVGRIFI